MKRVYLATILLALLAALPLARPTAAEGEDPAEWTVMFYLCGSDLESRHGYATGNLEEIADCASYSAMHGLFLEETAPELSDAAPGTVNVVIETGGSREWHAADGDLGMQIDPGALQRWRFDMPDRISFEDEACPFVLEDTQPLASMADPQTLCDFIRWGVENHPAKKYALVLWDHGLGSKKGLFIDELFGGDTMSLDALRTALADSGAQFEAVIFDACMMGSIETAWAISDSANWMVASEEVVAGQGTAIGDWLQQLIFTPQWDGRRLGRWICDMTQRKYAGSDGGQAQDTLTWAVIDLDQIDRVARLFDRFFADWGTTYANNPFMMMNKASVLKEAFEFGLNGDNMIDLAGIFYNPYLAVNLDWDMYSELLDALSEAVVYNVHGPDRSQAGGLSFCYAVDLTPSELDAYALNCPSPSYLAFLDAINPTWTAPDWVYEQAERLPEILELPDYQVRVEKYVDGNGVPAIAIKEGYASLNMVLVDLYRLNDQTGRTVRLGSTLAQPDFDEARGLIYNFNGFAVWPTVEGVHCDSELVFKGEMGMALYNIPVRIGSDNYLLRCGYDEFADEPLTIYGLWEGYDADSGVFNRNVVPLSAVVGQEFTLLYPIDGGEEGRTLYEASEPLTMYRQLEMAPKPLASGIYYIDFWVKDGFKRRLEVGRAEVYWDGETLSVPEGAWQGEMTLTVPEE